MKKSYKVVEKTVTSKTLVEDTVSVIAYDYFYGKHFDTGIRLINDKEVIDSTLLFLHRNTSSTTFTTTTEDQRLELATV